MSYTHTQTDTAFYSLGLIILIPNRIQSERLIFER